jgi:hypothetical protein
MAQFDDEWRDQELNELLHEWKAPAAPARLRAAALHEPAARWWRRVWTASVRVPLPVAVGLVLVAIIVAWRWKRPAEYDKTEHQLMPVAELHAKVIRREHARN